MIHNALPKHFHTFSGRKDVSICPSNRKVVALLVPMRAISSLYYVNLELTSSAVQQYVISLILNITALFACVKLRGYYIITNDLILILMVSPQLTTSNPEPNGSW